MPDSRIFIRNVTVLDCAIWHSTRGPIGRSWNVDLEWFGTTDHEGVVMDFSQAKKLGKQLIDTYFDHRLLIGTEQTKTVSGGRYVCLPETSCPSENRFYLDTYQESLCILPQDVLTALCTEDKGPLEILLAERIKEAGPKNVSSVKVKLRDHCEADSERFFNYLHSLRMHSGNCQRFHGHSNTIEIYEDGQLNASLSATVAKFLNGKYLITEEYLCPYEQIANNFHGSHIKELEFDTAQYQWIVYSGTQGLVYACVPKERLIVMSEESTIENIAAWIHKKTFSNSKNISIYAFEGINKGAISS